jgi:hypothetical protein
MKEGETQMKTYTLDAECLDLEGELLVTVYEDRVTVAHREKPSARWSVPFMMEDAG